MRIFTDQKPAESNFGINHFMTFSYVFPTLLQGTFPKTALYLLTAKRKQNNPEYLLISLESFPSVHLCVNFSQLLPVVSSTINVKIKATSVHRNIDKHLCICVNIVVMEKIILTYSECICGFTYRESKTHAANYVVICGP